MTLVPHAEEKSLDGAFPYRDRVEDLRRVLVQQGSLGLLLIDTSALAQIEPRLERFPRVSAAELRSRLEEMCAGAGVVP